MKLRKAKKTDAKELLKLHRAAAKTENGTAREPNEISQILVQDFVNLSLKKGLIFVIEHPNNSQKLIAEIHCHKLEPKSFKHIFSNLTLVVHPDFQGQGLGKKIFLHLLEEIKNKHHDIARVELMVRQNNLRGIKLYQFLGFEIEGICKKRILDSKNKLGSDLMMAWFNPKFKSSS